MTNAYSIFPDVLPPCPITLPTEYPESVRRYGADPHLLLQEFCMLEEKKPGFVASLKDIAERGELSSSDYLWGIHGHLHDHDLFLSIYSELDMGELLGDRATKTAPSAMWLFHGVVAMGHTPATNYQLAALIDLIDVFLPLWEQRTTTATQQKKKEAHS